jgi:hypothetical protein
LFSMSSAEMAQLEIYIGRNGQRVEDFGIALWPRETTALIFIKWHHIPHLTSTQLPSKLLTLSPKRFAARPVSWNAEFCRLFGK